MFYIQFKPRDDKTEYNIQPDLQRDKKKYTGVLDE